MRHFYTITQALLALLTIFTIGSCSTDDDPVQLDSGKQIITFKIDTTLGQIDETNHTITITVPRLTDLTKAKPVIAVSANAVVTPSSGAQVDLTQPVTYTVKAQDNSKQDYVVTARMALNLQNRINAFEIKSGAYTYQGVINDTTFTVKIGAPFTGTGKVDRSKATTAVTIPTGATMEPAANAVVDFSFPVKYKITAPNGEIQEYTVSLLNTEANLQYFDVPLSDFVENGSRQSKIAVTGTEQGLWGEEVTGLTAPFAIFHVLESEDVSHLPIKNVQLSEGATISPAADAPQNFNNDVTYTVTSQYGNTKQYTIRAFKKKIIMRYEFMPTSFIINGTSGNLEEYISAHDIAEAWLLGDGDIEYPLSVQAATRYPRNYVTTRIQANTATLPRGFYRLKVKLSNGDIVSLTHRFYMY